MGLGTVADWPTLNDLFQAGAGGRPQVLDRPVVAGNGPFKMRTFN